MVCSFEHAARSRGRVDAQAMTLQWSFFTGCDIDVEFHFVCDSKKAPNSTFSDQRTCADCAKHAAVHSLRANDTDCVVASPE